MELAEAHLVGDDGRRQDGQPEPALDQQLDRPQPGQLDRHAKLEAGLGTGRLHQRADAVPTVRQDPRLVHQVREVDRLDAGQPMIRPNDQRQALLAATAIQRRLAVAREEVASFEEYDFIVINDELTAAVDRLRAIVLAERARLGRMRRVAHEIVGKIAAVVATTIWNYFIYRYWVFSARKGS